MSFLIESHPIAVAPLREWLASPDCGGFVFFEGRVRNHHRGRNVTGLRYEAYLELAQKEGRRLVDEVARKYGVRAAAIHAVGDLQPGDLAVWVGAASSHRDQAFAACRDLIDSIKSRVPIWKHETYTSGQGQWIEGCSCPPETNLATPTSMPTTLPLEDTFTDIIAKAQSGLGLNDETLAARAGASLPEISNLKNGVVDQVTLHKVATALGLGADALLALAQSRYNPSPIEVPEGLAHFNSVFDGMTVNSFLVWDAATKDAAFFDTGSDGQPMLDFARKHGLKVKHIFITHIHTDHIFDLDRLVEKTGAHAWVCGKEPLAGAESFSLGRIFPLGSLMVGTRPGSGHAAGGGTYFIQGLAKPVAVVGDSLFAGSMGRALVSYADALRHNREQVLTLPDATIICPGHGPLTTVGEQKYANPFFAF